MLNVQPKGKRTPSLNHLYSTHRDADKALPHPPFGKSAHHFILLIPAYKQKLKQEAPVTQSIKQWSDEADAKLQDCCAIRLEYIPPTSLRSTPLSVTVFNNKCIADVLPTVTVRTYPQPEAMDYRQNPAMR